MNLKRELGQWKGKSQSGKKNLQSVSLIRDKYINYKKKSKESAIRNKPPLPNMGKRSEQIFHQKS